MYSWCTYQNSVCGKCEDKHRINLHLNSQVKALTEMYKEISCMVAEVLSKIIELGRLMRIGKISRRVEEN